MTLRARVIRLRTWWADLIERHLVAEDPDESRRTDGYYRWPSGRGYIDIHCHTLRQVADVVSRLAR